MACCSTAEHRTSCIALRKEGPAGAGTNPRQGVNQNQPANFRADPADQGDRTSYVGRPSAPFYEPNRTTCDRFITTYLRWASRAWQKVSQARRCQAKLPSWTMCAPLALSFWRQGIKRRHPRPLLALHVRICPQKSLPSSSNSVVVLAHNEHIHGIPQVVTMEYEVSQEPALRAAPATADVPKSCNRF